MLDIKYIRENCIEFTQKMLARGINVDAKHIIFLDQEKRNLLQNIEECRKEKNLLIKQIAQLKKTQQDCQELIAKTNQLSQKIDKDDQKLQEISGELQNILNSLPNIIDASVIIGEDETSNVIKKSWGILPIFDVEPKPHHILLPELMDFEQSSQISGARFCTLYGDLSKLERKLIEWCLKKNVNIGYQECSPPLLVRPQTMFGTGQLPKFAEDSFQTTNSDLFLIPTAEVALTNLLSNKIVDFNQLPIRLTAATPCFRSEAGSSGQDTQGMIRLHQFWKVEIVSIVHPENSANELERMTSHVESLLEDLELPYRRMELCSGDLGFSAAKTYDLEVWFPAQNKYREVSSCSNCNDFQARRMQTRFKDQDKKNKLVHTLNGSSLAIGRIIAALLENFQNHANLSQFLLNKIEKLLDN